RHPTSSDVIPAKAGIQFFGALRKGWFPAFAGMTTRSFLPPFLATRRVAGARALYTRRIGTRNACPDDVRLAPVAGGACLRGPAVHGRLAGRTPSGAGAGATGAAGGLHAGAGGVLLVVDVLRRGRHRRAHRSGLPADLPRPDPVAAVRLADPGAAGAGLGPPPHRLDRRLPVLALRPRARAGGAGRGAGGDRGDPLLRAAVQGGGHERGRAQRAAA